MSPAFCHVGKKCDSSSSSSPHSSDLGLAVSSAAVGKGGERGFWPWRLRLRHTRRTFVTHTQISSFLLPGKKKESSQSPLLLSNPAYIRRWYLLPFFSFSFAAGGGNITMMVKSVWKGEMTGRSFSQKGKQ